MVVTIISAADAAKLMAKPESHFMDFKAIEVSPAKITRAISAFANADGGELLVGVDDTSTGMQWRGFEDIEAANGLIQAIEAILPIGPDCRIEFLIASGLRGVVVHIEVAKTRQIVCTANGETYVRRAAQNLPIRTSDQFERLRLNKGLASFETNSVAVPLQTITNSGPTIRFMLDIVPHQEPEPWLRKQMLIVGDHPTVAGLLLFSEEPQAALPKQCGIKIYRYRTSDDEGTREALEGQPTTVEGCAYDQVYEAVARTKAIVEGIKRMTPEGLVEVEYPEETLHEIITNAVLHRDYSIPDDIHIRIYDNRIEVQSPGTLPGHVTPENILSERFARNGGLVRIINKFPNPPNKDVGEGLNTAFRAMNRLHLKEPVVEQRDNAVWVTIRHEQLASPQERIMQFVESNGTISNGDAREVCLIREDWRIRTIIKKMVDAGMLEKVPGSTTSNTAYRKPRTT
ncbi:MAG TPA: ATP-binding protein [Burkholderiaceae bacterium]|jgi:ATP-dependent DNA helicase RecG|nr:ATP-binding protein [Burkholderiaceae bacterium]